MIKIELVNKEETLREYRIRYRKDRRFGWEDHQLFFNKSHTNKWKLRIEGYFHRSLSWEIVVKIENILRGLNS